MYSQYFEDPVGPVASAYVYLMLFSRSEEVFFHIPCINRPVSCSGWRENLVTG